MDRSLAKLIVVLLVLGASSAKFLQEANQLRAPLPPTPSKEKYMDFLKKYGYFDHLGPKLDGPIPTEDEQRQAIESMQRFAGIPVTGEIDDQTVEMMSKPRCGVKDVNRQGRYVAAGGIYKWSKNDLSYKTKNYPGNNSPAISDGQVDSDIVAAFKVWSDVTPLTFTKKSDTSAEIRIKFGSGTHTPVSGDPAFDGKGGVLGHAFYPNSGWGNTNGDVHLDDDEEFTQGTDSGTNLFLVMAHEIGHALGLAHSASTSALMYPYYPGYIPNFSLPQDDINGIRSIYGSK